MIASVLIAVAALSTAQVAQASSLRALDAQYDYTPTPAPTQPYTTTPPNYATTAPSTYATSYANLYEQCGGTNYPSKTCVTGAKCYQWSQWYHQCIPQDDDDYTYGYAKTWEQCGGQGWTADCEVPNACVKFSPYYSQCLPPTLDHYALCGQNDGKDIHWTYYCTAPYTCQSVGGHDYRCV